MAKVSKKKTNKKAKETGCCYDCKFAYLMQSHGFNPIISECQFNKDREVARLFNCDKGEFERINEEDRVIHPMIYLK